MRVVGVIQMEQGSSQPCLSALFVDYDNIYLSLKRKNEEAARRFAKNAGLWLREIDSGALITPTNAPTLPLDRRIVLNRCYGNPVPRRSNKDNSTDMNSFPFVRHHFLRAGSEIIDCPPLTAQLKNSSDIRMVMDIRDLLTHDTYYDEFIILSGDADFTPVLHRLRAHARRTIIYANDHTATPYTAICDGEIQEKDLINLLVTGHVTESRSVGTETHGHDGPENSEILRTRIVDEIIVAISEADAPVPIESLADRAQRNVGHEMTIGTNWVGHGNFLTFLAENLPDHIELTDQAPYLAFDKSRMNLSTPDPATLTEQVETVAVAQDEVAETPVPAMPKGPADAALGTILSDMASDAALPEATDHGVAPEAAPAAPTVPEARPVAPAPEARPVAPAFDVTAVAAAPQANATTEPPMASAQASLDASTAIQRSIARIHDACQAPPLAPPEYRLVFEMISEELQENGLHGQATANSVVARAAALAVDFKPDDVRFIIDVISEADPWFEQGASANLFAGRFRNFVVARCRGQGLQLTIDELDLIDAWFAGQNSPAQVPESGQGVPLVENGAPVSESAIQKASQDQIMPEQEKSAPLSPPAVASMTPQVEPGAAPSPDSQSIDSGEPMGEDELPRIVRSRLRG